MSLPSSIKVELNEVSQEIDLEEITGVDLGSNTPLKEAIGQALIDFMVDRSKSSKDINRDQFLAYKKSYKESDEFEAYAKTNKVNMDLSGNMLSDIDVLNITGNTIKLGFNDDVNNKKAYNHMTGDTVRPRKFFGLRDKDVREVLGAFEDDINLLKKSPKNEIDRFIKAIQRGEKGPEVKRETETLFISVSELFNGES